MEKETYTIDATDKVLGRLATQIAVLLKGKQRPTYLPYKENKGDLVIIKNAGKIKLTGKKMEQKTYFRHSEYVGGAKEIPIKRLLEEKPAEALRLAVLGMLPKNKLRKQMIKRLKIEI